MNDFIVVREERAPAGDRPENETKRELVIGPVCGTFPTEQHAEDTAKSLAFSDAENNALFNYVVYKRTRLVTASPEIKINVIVES